MTREEAIAILEVSKHMATSGRLYNQAIDMAIEALSTLSGDIISRADAIETIMPEPMNEPKYPIWFADKLKELPSADAVVVVRCKDCCHRVHDEERGLYYCEKYYGQGDVSDENFCQWGERKAR